MRIAVYHDLPSGGAKRAVYEQAGGLRRLGHEVEALLPATAEESFLPLADAGIAVRTFTRERPPERERVLEGRGSPLDALRWLRFLARLPAAERALARAIDDGGYDVVLVHPSQFTQAPYLLRYLRTRSLYFCQEPMRAAHERRVVPEAVRPLLRATLGRVDRTNLRAATTVAANSRFMAERIHAIYGREPRVVYLGVDTTRFRPLGEERGDYLLAVSALHPLKGLDFLVETVGRLPPTLRPPLLIVGDRARAAERQRLEHRAAELNVDLRFRIRVPEDELVLLYNGARLVLFAAHDEPFGFVPLEAMACGRPVLAVAEGGVRETVVDGETGFLEARDPARFAARMAALLQHPEEAERVARTALPLVRERWSWQRSVRELAGVLAETAEAAV